MVQQPWFLVSRTVANALYNHLIPHQVKRERHYKVYNRTSAYTSRVSPRAARSSVYTTMHALKIHLDPKTTEVLDPE